MLHLSGDDFHSMAERARSHAPEEACGLLAGYRDEEGEAFVEHVFFCGRIVKLSATSPDRPRWPS